MENPDVEGNKKPLVELSFISWLCLQTFINWFDALQNDCA